MASTHLLPFHVQRHQEKRIFKFFQGIQKSSKKAFQIISSLLQFSRKSESKMGQIHLVQLEPFFTTKPVDEETGLGLSVSYMIITNNRNGTMEVDSEVGRGTRFVIRLPLQSDLS